MEALTLSRKDYSEGIQQVAKACADDKTYIEKFTVKFPDGINTVNALEICRMIQDSSLDSKMRLMRLCIQGKNCEVTCPNGETEKFCMTNADDAPEAFPLFQHEPLALLAIADCIYGYLLKKYVRLSKPKAAAAR